MDLHAIKVTEKWQFTIPTRLRKALKVAPGDYLETTVENGALLLKPRKQILIDPDQAWFWSPEWQAKEREVDEAVRRGKTRRASSVKALMKELRK